MKTVGIIDYQLGNLFSVIQACKEIGLETTLCSKADQLSGLDGFILPGVGSFKEAMNNLRESGMDRALKNEIEHGKPLFGICLGLQLLFDSSDEFGLTEGLGLLRGRVQKFLVRTETGTKVRVPNIGWNTLKYKVSRDKKYSPLRDLNERDYMYFVHSYYVLNSEESCILTYTEYASINYISSVHKDNIFATQFHPEKSAEKGLSIYRNWALLNNLI